MLVLFWDRCGRVMLGREMYLSWTHRSRINQPGNSGLPPASHHLLPVAPSSCVSSLGLMRFYDFLGFFFLFLIAGRGLLHFTYSRMRIRILTLMPLHFMRRNSYTSSTYFPLALSLVLYFTNLSIELYFHEFKTTLYPIKAIKFDLRQEVPVLQPPS